MTACAEDMYVYVSFVFSALCFPLCNQYHEHKLEIVVTLLSFAAETPVICSTNDSEIIPKLLASHINI